MNLAPYSARSPEQLNAIIPKAISMPSVRKIVLPAALFSTDKRLLLVGRNDQRTFKLPTRETEVDTRRSDSGFDLHSEIKKLSDFLFFGDVEPTNLAFTGLIRHKLADQVLVCPVVSNLEAAHDQTSVVQSTNWIDRSSSPDFWWATESEVTNLVQQRGDTELTENTKTIVRHTLARTISNNK